jgi:hypothetical protein
MKDAGRRREKRIENRSVRAGRFGGSDTTPTWRIRIPNVLKKNTDDDVVKIDRSITAAMVIQSNGHLGSSGQVA